MSGVSTREALARATRRVAFHAIQAAIEGLKAVEAVIEEIGAIGEDGENGATRKRNTVQKIEIE